jgi:hypothetical protein
VNSPCGQPVTAMPIAPKMIVTTAALTRRVELDLGLSRFQPDLDQPAAPNSFPIRVHSTIGLSVPVSAKCQTDKPENHQNTPATINQCGYYNSQRMLNYWALG